MFLETAVKHVTYFLSQLFQQKHCGLTICIQNLLEKFTPEITANSPKINQATFSETSTHTWHVSQYFHLNSALNTLGRPSLKQYFHSHENNIKTNNIVKFVWVPFSFPIVTRHSFTALSKTFLQLLLLVYLMCGLESDLTPLFHPSFFQSSHTDSISKTINKSSVSQIQTYSLNKKAKRLTKCWENWYESYCFVFQCRTKDHRLCSLWL